MVGEPAVLLRLVRLSPSGPAGPSSPAAGSAGQRQPLASSLSSSVLARQRGDSDGEPVPRDEQRGRCWWTHDLAEEAWASVKALRATRRSISSCEPPRRVRRLWEAAGLVDPGLHQPRLVQVVPQGSCKVLRQAVDLRRCWRREAVIRRGISTVTSSDPPPGRSDLCRRRVLTIQVECTAVAQEA